MIEDKPIVPVWFKVLNFGFLLPVLIWPLVFFSTIFFFDNPQNFIVTFAVFLAVNAYPFYLFFIMRLNLKLYLKYKAIAIALPLLLSLTFIIAILQFMGGISGIKTIYNNIQENKKALKAAEESGNLGHGFRKDKNYVYSNDTIIEGADPNTFEIVNWEWAKDNKSYFFKGKRVPYIDYATFKYLDYNYAIDKNNVYYDDEIIEGADAKTFKYIEGSQDGKDKSNCYRYGEKVDCSVLLKDE
jgi:hypothetical protein